jgi:HSP20 family protein
MEAIMIDRYDAMGRGMSLRHLMDRMLEDAFVLPREGGAEGWGGPALDVYEEGDNLVVEAYLPGMKPEDLDVNVERGVLTISGRTESERERRERNYLLREQRSGRFTRSLQLPAAYQTENCQANYEQGILRLVFPKAEEAKARRIQIGSGGSQAIEGQTNEGKQPTAAGGLRRKPEDRT